MTHNKLALEKLKQTDYVLGIDFGTKKMGCAVGQGLTGTASPAKILHARNGTLSAPNELQSLIKEWRIKLIVVGLPISMDESDNPITEAARRFAAKIEKASKLPVVLHDERLSTRAARELIAERGAGQSLQRGGKNDKVDMIAACLILESFFGQYF